MCAVMCKVAVHASTLQTWMRGSVGSDFGETVGIERDGKVRCTKRKMPRIVQIV